MVATTPHARHRLRRFVAVPVCADERQTASRQKAAGRRKLTDTSTLRAEAAIPTMQVDPMLATEQKPVALALFAGSVHHCGRLEPAECLATVARTRRRAAA